MLNINYIINFLDTKQISIDDFYYKKIKNYELNNNNVVENEVNEKNKMEKTEKLDKYDFYIPPAFNIIFEKSIKDFYYDSKMYRNKSSIFTFINSIFLIENKFFNLNNDIERERLIKQFVKKMNDELFEKDLYNKFEYTKNRKINKVNLQLVLNNSYLFRNDEYFNLFIIYLSNYLGINIYVFKVINHNIDFINSDYYLTNNCLHNPSFMIILENEIYKPVMLVSNNRSILTYDKNNIIIDNIWNYLKINDNIKKESEKNIIDQDEEISYKDIEKQDTINEDLTKNDVTNKETIIKKKIRVKKVKTEDVKTEDVKTEDVKTDEVKTEDVKTEDVKTEETLNNNDIKNEKEGINKKYKMNDLKNSKIDELKKICENEGISILKPSEKTSKMINKLKNELLNDILEIINV